MDCKILSLIQKKEALEAQRIQLVNGASDMLHASRYLQSRAAVTLALLSNHQAQHQAALQTARTIAGLRLNNSLIASKVAVSILGNSSDRQQIYALGKQLAATGTRQEVVSGWGLMVATAPFIQRQDEAFARILSFLQGNSVQGVANALIALAALASIEAHLEPIREKIHDCEQTDDPYLYVGRCIAESMISTHPEDQRALFARAKADLSRVQAHVLLIKSALFTMALTANSPDEKLELLAKVEDYLQPKWITEIQGWALLAAGLALTENGIHRNVALAAAIENREQF